MYIMNLSKLNMSIKLNLRKKHFRFLNPLKSKIYFHDPFKLDFVSIIILIFLLSIFLRQSISLKMDLFSI